MSPVKTIAPAASLMATLCGIPASLLSNRIWKASFAPTLSSVGVKAMFSAATSTTAAGPAGLGAPDGGAALGATDALGAADGDAGAYVQPGVVVAQAATARMVRPATSRRIVRIGGQDLEVVAGDRGR